MGELPHPKIIAALALLLLGALIFLTLTRRDRSSSSKIDLDYLLVDPDTKQISKGAAVMMGAFVFTTWMMVYLTLTSKMTEGYFGVYVGAWVAPTVTKLIVSAKAATEAK